MNSVFTTVGFAIFVLCVLGIVYFCLFYQRSQAGQLASTSDDEQTREETFEIPPRYPTIFVKPVIPQGVVSRLVRYHQQNVLVAYLPADVVARIGKGFETGVVQLGSQAAIRAVVSAQEQAAFETQVHYPRYFIAAQP